MLLVIFGAGASFDSCADFPCSGVEEENEYRPPLAKDLFALRFGSFLERYREIRPVVYRLRPGAQRGLEEELQILKSDDRLPSSPRAACCHAFGGVLTSVGPPSDELPPRTCRPHLGHQATEESEDPKRFRLLHEPWPAAATMQAGLPLTLR